jgi:hypothetical protein
LLALAAARYLSAGHGAGAGAERCTPRRMPTTGRAAARRKPVQNGPMALSRSSSWKEHRLANRLDVDGAEYSVDLVARKATGVEGWKVTVVFLPRSGSEVKAELPNAASTAEVRRLVTELEGADERLRQMCRAARAN